MLAKIKQTFKGLLLDPTETLKNLREEPIEEAFAYFLLITPIFIILTLIVSAFTLASAVHESTVFWIVYLIAFLIAAYIGCIIGLFIGAAIQHIFVYLLGGRKGFEQTIKASIYSITPMVVIGWIPFVGIIGSIWSLVLEVVAIRELHEITTARAVIAVILTILFIIAAIILVVIIVMLVGLGLSHSASFNESLLITM